MRIDRVVFVTAILISVTLFCGAQSSSTPTAGQTEKVAATQGEGVPPQPATPVAAHVDAASQILQPSLDRVRQTLTGLHVEKWKRGSVRDEASADINSLVVDLQQRMPGLLKDADAAPGALSKTLPVSRHVDALYDVLLRVVEAARMAAPDDQTNALRQALGNLEKARLVLGDSMETVAGSQEKQLVDLRVTVQKQAAFRCPAPPPAPECPKPPVKKPVRKKPAATPTGTTQSAPQKTPAGGTTSQKAPGAPAPAKPNSTTPNSTPQH